MHKTRSSLIISSNIINNNNNGNDSVDDLGDMIFNTILDMVEWVVFQNSVVIQSWFLLGYRIILSSDELYQALYTLITRQGGKAENDSKLSKLNVFLYMWGELSYHYDWKSTPDRLAKLMDLAKSTSLSPGQYNSFRKFLVKDNKKRIKPRSMTFTPNGPVESSAAFSPNPRRSIIMKLRKTRSKTDEFMPPWFSIDAEVMAAQMTLLEHENFSAVKVHELIPSKSRGTETSIDAVAARFNEVAGWVATQILFLPQPKLQARAIKRFAIISEQLLLLNNFQSVGQVLCGIYNSSITRLKRVWPLLSSKTTARLQRLEEVMSPTQNFQLLREQIKEAAGKPLVPYLPLVLRDVTFMCDGNPNKNADGSFNFDKLLRLGKYILWFRDAVVTAYRLPLDMAVQKTLLELKPLSDEELYKLSIEYEPRQSPTLTPISVSSASLPTILEL